MTKKKSLQLFFLLCLLIFTCTTIGRAQDAITVASKYYKVRLENDRVRVLETNANPGDTIPMHAHPCGFAYAVTACNITFIFPDGKTKHVQMPAGEVVWHEPMVHSMIIHDNPIHIIHTELKNQLKPDQIQNIK